jgi:isopenicillin N synthase-like dioxygenase
MALVDDGIPQLEIGSLFEGGPTEPIDRAVLAAASDVGFMTVVGVPETVLADPQRLRRSLLRLFGVPIPAQRRFWKRNFAPENPNLYCGWFPLESGPGRSREGFEIGPDLVRELPDDGSEDLLYEPSVLPTHEELPGWHTDAVAYFLAMEAIGFGG